MSGSGTTSSPTGSDSLEPVEPVLVEKTGSGTGWNHPVPAVVPVPPSLEGTGNRASAPVAQQPHPEFLRTQAQLRAVYARLLRRTP